MERRGSLIAKAENHPFKVKVRSKKIIFTSSFDLVREISRELSLLGATKNNGGNIAWRENDQYFITTTGADLGKLEPGHIALIHSCNVPWRRVEYSGPRRPSTETITWYIIMAANPEIRAIIHGHDDDGNLIINRAQEIGLPIVEVSYSYGTPEFAQAILEKLDDRLFVVINTKDHKGFVAFGKTFNQARDRYRQYLNNLRR